MVYRDKKVVSAFVRFHCAFEVVFAKLGKDNFTLGGVYLIQVCVVGRL
jgi:hypothetical protein